MGVYVDRDLKIKCDDDECVEKKSKMKMFDFVIICNCK
jgi:hypothetical protein